MNKTWCQMCKGEHEHDSSRKCSNCGHREYKPTTPAQSDDIPSWMSGDYVGEDGKPGFVKK